MSVMSVVRRKEVILKPMSKILMLGLIQFVNKEGLLNFSLVLIVVVLGVFSVHKFDKKKKNFV